MSEGASDEGLDFGAGDDTGPEDPWGFVGEVDDGGLESDFAGAAVEDEVDVDEDFGVDVLGGGGAEGHEGIGGGGGDGAPGLADDFEGDGVAWDSDGDGGASSGGDVGDVGFFG